MMFGRKHLPVWIGIILLSGMFLMGQDTWAPTECIDNDSDGYGNPASSQCTYPDLDCDDSNAEVNPGATEGSAGDPTCGDGLDNDCDGLTDGDDAGCQVCLDGDEDGYGDPASEACTYPELDCDDSTADVNPGETEICGNGIDDDCDTLTDGDDPACGGTGLLPDTDQSVCYNTSSEITCPSSGAAFYGQDAQYDGNQPSYLDNGNGTVTDQNTGLMWQQDPGDKMTYDVAIAGADSFSLAGYDDWRVPTIKELYSLILFSGGDPSSYPGSDPSGLTPFIDDDTFAFEYGDTSAGERLIDSQWVTDSVYLDTVMGGNECFFGVNFADGRIKCYPTSMGMDYFVIYVRGSSNYGVNNFSDNGNGTITDQATGLTWQQDDNGSGVIWEDALDYCEDLTLGGQDDWRLPNAKELQSIVDYSRSPGTTSSAAIDPVFNVTSILNEAGQTDYPCYWTGSTHADWQGGGANGAYVAFGRAMGYWMNQWQDVHGAGAQRSDPKFGDPDDYPTGHGPQGDAIRIYNYVRCVRGE